MALTTDATRNPIKVTGTTAAATAVTTNNVKIHQIRWHNPTSAGHLLSVTDTAGNQICKAVCDAVNKDFAIDLFGEAFVGIKIDDLDSGEVYILLG